MEPEAVDDETQARFDQETEQLRAQLRSDLDLVVRANSALADAIGFDRSKLPPELLRELEETAKRMSEYELRRLARE